MSPPACNVRYTCTWHGCPTSKPKPKPRKHAAECGCTARGVRGMGNGRAISPGAGIKCKTFAKSVASLRSCLGKSYVKHLAASDLFNVFRECCMRLFVEARRGGKGVRVSRSQEGSCMFEWFRWFMSQDAHCRVNIGQQPPTTTTSQLARPVSGTNLRTANECQSEYEYVYEYEQEYSYQVITQIWGGACGKLEAPSSSICSCVLRMRHSANGRWRIQLSVVARCMQHAYARLTSQLRRSCCCCWGRN